MSQIGIISSPQDLSKIKADVQAAVAAEKVRLILCCGNGCVASGAREVFSALNAELEKKNIPLKVDLLEEKENGVRLSASGCQGLCQYGPILRSLSTISICRSNPKMPQR